MKSRSRERICTLRRKQCVCDGTEIQTLRCRRKYRREKIHRMARSSIIFLAQDSSGPVTLEILDTSGKLVRKYSSADIIEPLDKIAPKHPIPMYWVREERILSAEAGRRRFVWDFRYPGPNSLGHSNP